MSSPSKRCACCWQVNESWTLEDCTVARCEGDNHIVLLPPKPVPQITCVNGHQPVKVQNQQEPCQYHYECECERRPGTQGGVGANRTPQGAGLGVPA